MRHILAPALALLIGGLFGYWLGLRHTVAAAPPSAPKTATLDMSLTDGAQYRVRKVIDGDSIILENGIRVCYHGVRAPEAGHYVKDPAPMG